jgi:hypothetical protein
MKNLLKLISFIGLGLTVVPAFLVFMGIVSFDTNKMLMLFGSICWFGTAPFWINKG